MDIFDNHNNKIASVVYFEEIKNGRNFVSEKSDEFQIGLFQLESKTTIARHIHPGRNRNIDFTSEAIVLLEGEIEIDLYDLDKNLIKKITLQDKDSIVFHKGGHSINLLKESKFIEFKQGPYDQDLDKELF